MARPRLRPAGFDDLGLREALGEGRLPLLVAAMAFLAALALAGALGAAALGRHWQGGAAATLTIEVPHPGDPAIRGAGAPPLTAANRRDAVVALLSGAPGIASARALGEAELGELLRPWLGADIDQLALPLPGVIEVHLADPAPDLAPLAARIAAAAPGTAIERHDIWGRRIAALTRSLLACALAIVALVTAVAALVIAVATRAGLAARHHAIEIVHGLGATDGYVAGRFARRVAIQATLGGGLGAFASLPVLLALAALAAPFAAPSPQTADFAAEPGQALPLAIAAVATFPPALWAVLPALPLAGGIIGWLTARGTVRSWLRRMP